MSYVAEVTNPNFDIWRPEYRWLDKECSKCKLCWPICVTSVAESKTFTPFQSTTSRDFELDHSETSALHNPKITLNATRSSVPHTWVTSIHEA